MKILYVILFFIFFTLSLSNCNIPSSTTEEDNIIKTPSQEKQATESSISILTMTDLEIIKKTADYLKSHGETLTFEETEIIYCHNETESVICKDDKGQDVAYKGEYLQIKYYPDSDSKSNESPYIVVFLGEGSKILGYYKDNLSK